MKYIESAMGILVKHLQKSELLTKKGSAQSDSQSFGLAGEPGKGGVQVLSSGI